MFKIDIQSFFNDKKFKNTVEALKLVRHFIPKKYTYYSAKELYQELNKKSIEEICQYFKIQLISNEKTKIPSKSYLENNKIIIEFKDNKELYKQFGIIMKVFNNGIYFNYPNNEKNDNIVFYEEKAEQFAIELESLLTTQPLLNMEEKFTCQPLLNMEEKFTCQPLLNMEEKFTCQPLLNMEEKFTCQPTVKKTSQINNKSQYNHESKVTNLLLEKKDIENYILKNTMHYFRKEVYL
ncbi:hypothetical protein KJQ64_06890 [Campylobacter lari]|uniref:hypothetical protein n=3 Tax=Campylobacter lari TaxID=201 RepID=UPI001BD986A1|nr:hypothetical protein [Campylobacter lari]MBT0822471.1 hypothetical protein [Campylobacter lari]